MMKDRVTSRASFLAAISALSLDSTEVTPKLRISSKYVQRARALHALLNIDANITGGKHLASLGNLFFDMLQDSGPFLDVPRHRG